MDPASEDGTRLAVDDAVAIVAFTWNVKAADRGIQLGIPNGPRRPGATFGMRSLYDQNRWEVPDSILRSADFTWNVKATMRDNGPIPAFSRQPQLTNHPDSF